MAAAWRAVCRNGGACGVDGETFRQIEEQGVDGWLGRLAKELLENSYRPHAVRQVLIPKKQPGKFRPLGIPCIRDRVAQTAAMLMLTPIFEADLQPEQYACREGRSALDAVRHAHRLVSTGHGEIVDSDLSNHLYAFAGAVSLAPLKGRKGRRWSAARSWASNGSAESTIASRRAFFALRPTVRKGGMISGAVAQHAARCARRQRRRRGTGLEPEIRCCPWSKCLARSAEAIAAIERSPPPCNKGETRRRDYATKLSGLSSCFESRAPRGVCQPARLGAAIWSPAPSTMSPW